MQDSLKVNVNDSLVGKLSCENDKFIYAYTSKETEFISLSMPPKDEQYINTHI